MNTERIIIVCGFPRSGTSLTMQMLNASGVRCSGEWPGFEDERARLDCGKVSADFMEEMKGGAVKILDPHLLPLPRGFQYAFVWLRRNRLQQARSMMKFMAAMRMPINDNAQNRKLIAASFERDESKAVAELRSHEGHSWLTLSFEDIITEPDTSSEILGDFLQLPAPRMRAVVIPRKPDCLEQMLELQQIESIR